uniref:Uncharacterized protein n=1 Tax=Kalanchoe fedtschenkoi TaxID=63787 RepID=A0A7N0TCN6_KALFE
MIRLSILLSTHMTQLRSQTAYDLNQIAISKAAGLPFETVVCLNKTRGAQPYHFLSPAHPKMANNKGHGKHATFSSSYSSAFTALEFVTISILGVWTLTSRNSSPTTRSLKAANLLVPHRPLFLLQFLPVQTHPVHIACRLIRHHVQQAVTSQDEAAAIIWARLVMVNSGSQMSVGFEVIVAYGAQPSEDAGTVAADQAVTCGFNAVQLVGMATTAADPLRPQQLVITYRVTRHLLIPLTSENEDNIVAMT